MCGIVGLLIKKESARASLGEMLAPMLACMSDRGPDSAGLAVFGEHNTTRSKARRRFSLFSGDAQIDWNALKARFTKESAIPAEIESIYNNAVLTADCDERTFAAWVAEAYPDLRLLSVGRSIHMFKDICAPAELIRQYHIPELRGSHAVGHTRMATESAVSPAHAHPFTAGEDFCLVHNGSLSNPYSLRRMLERRGIHFETDNDTEAACRFLEWRMREGETLDEAIKQAFVELDGFYTLLMATSDRMVLLRDPFACKPAVVAETDDYVAIASEFRSLAHLPGVNKARMFEPSPERIYSWSV
jgi:glutamate synthase domain-containing protein 1